MVLVFKALLGFGCCQTTLVSSPASVESVLMSQTWGRQASQWLRCTGSVEELPRSYRQTPASRILYSWPHHQEKITSYCNLHTTYPRRHPHPALRFVRRMYPTTAPEGFVEQRVETTPAVVAWAAPVFLPGARQLRLLLVAHHAGARGKPVAERGGDGHADGRRTAGAPTFERASEPVRRERRHCRRRCCRRC